MWFRLLFPILLSASLLSCGSTSPKLKELPEPGQTIIINGFSIVSPNEPYWNCIRGNTREQGVSLTKKGANPDETYAITVFTGQLPQFENNEAFVSFVRDILSNEQDTRFVESEFEAEVVSTKSGICVSAQYKAKDLLAEKRTSNTSPMILETVNLVCRNPNSKSEGVLLAYSHRYYPGQWNPPLSDKAQYIFESLVFDEDLKANTNKVCP